MFNVGIYANDNMSIWEVFTGTFIGTTNEMFSLISFTFYIVVFFRSSLLCSITITKIFIGDELLYHGKIPIYE